MFEFSEIKIDSGTKRRSSCRMIRFSIRSNARAGEKFQEVSSESKNENAARVQSCARRLSRENQRGD
jgi:hypothetical protein